MRLLNWSLALALASVLPVLADSTSHDGKCGNGVSCMGSMFGNCCSSKGWCGASLAYCGAGCQIEFGFCESTKGKISPDGTCGGDIGYTCKGSEYGDCCSEYGYCGSSEAYCGSGCMEAFGSCGELSKSTTASSNSTHSTVIYARDVTTTSTTSATPTALACPASNGTIFTASTGNKYQVQCYIDHYDGDMDGNPIYTNTLDNCIGLCDNKTGCVDVSWVSGSPQGPCYLKSAVGSPATKTSVWGAISLYPVVVASSTSYALSSPTEIACPAANSTVYTAACGAEFLIECQTDHYGGDMPNDGFYVSSLGDCIAACANTTGCVDVSWVVGVPKGPCYLKNDIGAASSPSNVHGARLVSNCTTASSTSVTSTSTSVSSSSAPSSTITPSANPTSSISTTTASVPTTLNSTTSSACFTKATPTTACIPCDGQGGSLPYCGADISTNYYNFVPKTCNTVYYTFDITNTTVAPDGITREALLVNGQMPGPTIEVNWGDTVVVTVNNKMTNNGTSIHFHGVRQNFTNEYDGVPSITQCPIAPGESMTYTWVATNYGSSWYHSHFAIQAWEGVLGPIIIHGPTTQTYDVDAGPIVLQDWTHVTVDSMYDAAQDPVTGGPRIMDNGLINGKNTWGADGTSNQTGQRFVLPTTFTPGQTYLFRIVNSAIQSTFKFYIDGHSMTVISADFVPIVPYTTDILNINIGQRYMVLVTADQPVGDYWMRADNQDACATTTQATDIKGIVRYIGSPGGTPTTTAYNYTGECVDEPYASLVPYLPLTATNDDVEFQYDVTVAPNSANLFKWYLSGTTFQSQYDDPTLVHFFENGTAPTYSGNLILDIPNGEEWVYVIIESGVPLPHPIHLHGHDFFILAEGAGSYSTSVALNLDNPPRRDTALLPTAGYLVLAFETDNPGVWLMHCHIGWHTSMGFALQILEQKSRIVETISDSCVLGDTCSTWDTYMTANNIQVLDSGV